MLFWDATNHTTRLSCVLDLHLCPTRAIRGQTLLHIAHLPRLKGRGLLRPKLMLSGMAGRAIVLREASLES